MFNLWRPVGDAVLRREIIARYGENALYEGGLSVRTTLDPKLQLIARKALQNGLIKFDTLRGYRGPVTQIDICPATGACRSATSRGWTTCPNGASPWCSTARTTGLSIGLQPTRAGLRRDRQGPIEPARSARKT